MADGTLTNNTGTLTFAQQNNTITLKTANKFTTSNIVLTTQVTKAVLNSNTATNTFDIQVPNGNTTVTFNWFVDTNGNVLVT